MPERRWRQGRGSMRPLFPTGGRCAPEIGAWTSEEQRGWSVWKLLWPSWGSLWVGIRCVKNNGSARPCRVAWWSLVVSSRRGRRVAPGAH
jgi:hypothetical protein